MSERKSESGGEEKKLHEVVASVAKRVFEEYPGEKLTGRNLARMILAEGQSELGSLKKFEHTGSLDDFYKKIYDGLEEAVREGLLGIVPEETAFTPEK